MIKMKLWTVFYKPGSIGRTQSHGCDSKEEAIEFMAKKQNNGGFLKNVKRDGKNVSPPTMADFQRAVNRMIKN